MARSGSHSRKAESSFRIIGGAWRGRRLRYPVVTGLRPTPDRVRETLFNWLAPSIEGARVLDLFSGTGALGLEALSRGAASVDFVEQSPPLARALNQSIGLLDASGLVHCANAVTAVPRLAPGPFDLILLDPPFHTELASAALVALQADDRLSAETLLYVETEAQALPLDGLRLEKETRAGKVCGRLYSTP